MTLFEPYLWIRFCNVWATCAVRWARSSQRRAGHVEHLPRRAQVTFCQTSHVQIGWERFHSRDSGRRRWQAGDVYGTGDTRDLELLAGSSPPAGRHLGGWYWLVAAGVPVNGCYSYYCYHLDNKPIQHLRVASNEHKSGPVLLKSSYDCYNEHNLMWADPDW